MVLDVFTLGISHLQIRGYIAVKHRSQGVIIQLPEGKINHIYKLYK